MIIELLKFGLTVKQVRGGYDLNGVMIREGITKLNLGGLTEPKTICIQGPSLGSGYQ